MDKILYGVLPRRFISEIEEIENESGFIEEIRIRRGRQAYIVISGENRLLKLVAEDFEMQNILQCLSRGSLYAFRDTIMNGYISLGDGLRVGVIGRAGIERGDVVGIYDVSEFSFRLPNRIKIKCRELISLIVGADKLSSVLIYSPPGVGKTTLLRNIIKELSSGKHALRVGVIDSRGELAFGLEQTDLLVSILSLYPRKLGIEIAVRTMNAQLIVCDEIGDEHDASAIIDSQVAGVPIVATAHGSGLKDIFSHTGIRNLHRAGIFDYYVGIERGDDLDFIYTVNTREEADAYT